MSAITLIQGDLEKLPIGDLHLLADYYNISKRTDNLTNALSKVFLQKCLHAYMIDPELAKRLEELAISEEAAKKEVEEAMVVDANIDDEDDSNDEYIREQQQRDAAEYGTVDDDEYIEYGNYDDDDAGSTVVDEYEMDLDYEPMEKRQKVIGVHKHPAITIYSSY